MSDMSDNIASALPGVQSTLDKASGALEESGVPSMGSVEDKISEGLDRAQGESDAAGSAKTELEGAVKEKLDSTSADVTDMASNIDAAKDQAGDAVDKIKGEIA